MQVMRQIQLLWLLVSSWGTTCDAASFVAWRMPPAARSRRTTTIGLWERKPAGQGFGKPITEKTDPPRKVTESEALIIESNTPLSPTEEDTDRRSPEERAQQVLREKYGLRTLAEQQVEAQEKTRATQWAALQNKATTTNEDFDVFRVIPGPVLRGIDVFLKGGTALCTLLFVAAGIMMTLEAWSHVSGDAFLPPALDDFIVQTVEPNFTPGLLVLLSFSVTWGIFASLQLGSQGASYKEND